MMLWRRLKREFFAIEREAELERARYGEQDWRPLGALLTCALVLLAIHYLKFASTFQTTMQWLMSEAEYRQLLQHRYFGLFGELWWGAWHVLGYVLVPCLVIRYGFKERIRDYGLAWNRASDYLPWCILIAGLVIGFAYLASHRSDFLQHYPFYRMAQRSLFDLLAWEGIYLSQFVFLEFFFRGFLLKACHRRFGATALFVMVVPYVMIHFPKPWLEASGALLFGLVLGIIALRSHSIWGGVLVHTSVALSMDIMALVRGGRWPLQWWPQ